MNRKRNISPSLLAADFSILKQEISSVENLGVTRLHLDVMDGNFVNNLTFGPMIIESIKKLSTTHLETHLMINDPNKYIKDYIDAGSDTIIIHHEASTNVHRDLESIREQGALAGIALNPDTDISVIEEYIDLLDYILIMSVFPGFGGQKFISSTLEKMSRSVHLKSDRSILIGVDGGVGLDTIEDVYDTGIDITIVGSALFGAENISDRYKQLMNE